MILPPERDEDEERLRRALQRISAGVPKVENDKSPDKKDEQEVASLEAEARKAAVENDWLLIGLRKTYGYNLVLFMWVYFIVTFLLIILNSYNFYGMKISDTTLAAAIGGTAVSVLGVVGTIASGLFKAPEKK